MGSFLGHLMPGLFFLVFAFWWAVNIFVRFCKHKYKKIPFKSLASYPCPCSCCGRCKRWPFEGLIKIVVASTGVAGETITGFMDPVFSMGNKQHILMYIFFGLTGVVDILLHHGFPVPQGTDFAGIVIATTIELVLFRFHLHDRKPLDVHVHMLLVYTLCVTVVVLLVQMKYRNNPLPALATSFAFFVQGTWFIQVGQILYNPIKGAEKWDENDPESIMMVTIYFAWHLGLAFIFYLVLSLFISCIYRRCYPGSVETSVAMQRLVSKGTNGHTHIGMDESESDIEYHRPLINERHENEEE